MPDRVLVVDDDPALLSLEVALLEAEGHAVTAAEGGQEALALLRQQDFDVVVSDLDMPDLTGLDLLERVKEIDPDVVLVICTSHGRLDVAVKSLTAGAFDFVQKPFDLAHFASVVARGLQHRKLRDQTNVYKAAQAVFTTSDPERLPQVIVETAVRVLQGDYATILSRVADRFEPSGLFFGRSFADDKLWEALRTASERIEASREPLTLALDGRGFAVGHPLRAGDRSLGILWVLRRPTRRPFVARDVDHLALLSAQAALALDNLRLISDLNRRIEALEKTRRRLYTSARVEGVGRMAIDLATQLQNPLHYVQTSLREVERFFTDQKLHGAEEAVTDEEAACAVANAREGLKRVQAVIDDLGSVAQSRDHAEFELGMVARLAMRIARVASPVTLTIATDAALEGSPGQLAQALVALLHNADQAMAAQPAPKIDLRVRLDGDKAIVEVADNGEGIPPERLALVAEPFFSTRGRPGMGLVTVKEVVEHHGGTMRIRGVPGTGTTVILSLPGHAVDDAVFASGGE
jgi:two-component system NtrC family sensor kinase